MKWKSLPLPWVQAVLLLVFILLGFGLMLHPLGDPDVFIHLRDGQYWVSHHFQAGPEPFAYTVPDKEIEKVEVLFRIGLYLAYRLGGYSLLIILKALAMTLCLGLLGFLIYRRWPNQGVVLGLLAIAVVTPLARIMPERPYVITYLLLPLVLLLLDQYHAASGPNAQRAANRLWFLPLLVIPWVNLHPGFVVVFVPLGAELLDDVVSYWFKPDQTIGRRIKHLFLVSAACGLAGAFNPLGFSIYTFVISTTASQDFMKFLLEWGPPKWPQEYLFFITLCAVWLVQLLAFRQARIRDWLPLAVFSALALKSYRNMPLFLIMALAPWAGNLRWLWKKYGPEIKLNHASQRWRYLAGSLAGLGLLVWTAAIGRSFRLGEIPDMYPKQALAWLENHPVNGRLLAHDIWGGYIGWQTQGRVQIFIDGRFPLFGEKLYSDYRKIIWGNREFCLALLDKYQIQGLLVSPKNEMQLFRELWHSRNWALVYWDDVSLLYVRRNAGNYPLIHAFQYLAIDPKREPFFNPQAMDLAFLEAQRSAEIAPDSFLPRFFTAELALRMKDPATARHSFEQVLRIAPWNTLALFNLGLIAEQNQQYETAEKYFRRVLQQKLSPEYAGRAYFALARCLSIQPSRRQEALRFAEKAFRLNPADPSPQDLIQELRTKP